MIAAGPLALSGARLSRPTCAATLRTAASSQPERMASGVGQCQMWAAPIAQPSVSGGRCLQVAASASPDVAAATYFSPSAWSVGTAAILGAYLLYFAGLAALVPRGRPVKVLQKKQGGMYRLLVASIFGTLLPVVVMPWPALAVSGAWKAGLVYFLPVTLQLGVNIAVEIHLYRTGHMLAVYASTVGNNMARIALALAALVDMSLLGTPHPALWMVSCTQVAAFVLVMLCVVPAAISQLPLQAPTPTQPVAASEASG